MQWSISAFWRTSSDILLPWTVASGITVRGVYYQEGFECSPSSLLKSLPSCRFLISCDLPLCGWSHPSIHWKILRGGHKTGSKSIIFRFYCVNYSQLRRFRTSSLLLWKLMSQTTQVGDVEMQSSSLSFSSHTWVYRFLGHTQQFIRCNLGVAMSGLPDFQRKQRFLLQFIPRNA